MGLFDEVVGAFLKGDAGKYQAILSWVEEQGGIQVLLEKLQSGGYQYSFQFTGRTIAEDY